MLYFQMRESFNSALAPGTIKNQRNQATLYVKFMLIYNFNYLFPTITNVAMFSQFLANSYTSPRTIRNYLSGAKTWVQLHMGDIQPFLTYELGTLVKSYASSSSHTPVKAAPLTSDHIRLICNYIDNDPAIPLAVKPAILIAYTAMLRVSNILSPALNSWGGSHTLQTSDILVNHTGMKLIIRDQNPKQTQTVCH